MDHWICQQNIARFQTQLAAEPDKSRRKTLRGLLAREKRRLARLTSQNNDSGSSLPGVD